MKKIKIIFKRGDPLIFVNSNNVCSGPNGRVV
jgi:hypothetical protein